MCTRGDNRIRRVRHKPHAQIKQFTVELATGESCTREIIGQDIFTATDGPQMLQLRRTKHRRLNQLHRLRPGEVLCFKIGI